MSTLPPSKAALQQHIRRAVLQGAHYWVVQRCRTASYHPLLTGDGLAQNSGYPCGQNYNKLVYHAQSCCGVDAGRGVQMYTDTPEVHCLLHMQERL